MGRGYWLPPNAESLLCCDGFYIDSEAVYKKGCEQGWDEFINHIARKLQLADNSFEKVCEWQSCDLGESRFVIAENQHIQLVADDACGYVAVYAIIPENCSKPAFAKRSFPKYLQMLNGIVTEKYKGNVYHRCNSSHIEQVG